MRTRATRQLFYKLNENVKLGQTLEVTLAAISQRLPSQAERTLRDSIAADDDEDAPRTGTLVSWIRAIPIENRKGEDTGHKLLCAHLFRYTPKLNAPVYDSASTSTEVTLEGLKALLGPSKSTIECQAIIGVQGNNVVVMPGGSLGAGAINFYLQWLGEKCKVLGPGQAFRFSDNIERGKREELKGVKKVRLQFPLSVADKISFDPPKQENPRSGWLPTVMTNAVSAVMNSTVGGMSVREAASLNNIQFGIDLRVDAASDEARQSSVDGLLSVIPDELAKYVRFDIHDVGSWTAESLKVHASKGIAYEDGIPVERDVARKMFDFLTNLKASKRIPATHG